MQGLTDPPHVAHCHHLFGLCPGPLISLARDALDRGDGVLARRLIGHASGSLDCGSVRAFARLLLSLADNAVSSGGGVLAERLIVLAYACFDNHGAPDEAICAQGCMPAEVGQSFALPHHR